MRARSTRIALVTLACAAGAFVAWRALAGHDDVASTTASGSRANASDASSTLDRDRASDTRSAGAPASIRVETPDGPARLHGVVRLREDRVPVEGLVVTARFSGPEGRNVAQATTDVLGRYALEWPFAITLRSIDVAAGPTTASSELFRERRVAPSAPCELDLWVTRGAALEGRVVDEHGAPIAGAEVFVDTGTTFAPAGPHARVTTSARDGSFRVEHVGEHFHAHARAPGRACLVGLRGELAPNADAKGLEIVLAPAVTLRGIVVDPLDRPLEGVEVSVDGSTSSSASDATSVSGVRRFAAVRVRVTTLADGRFELADVPDRPWMVIARHRELRQHAQTVAPGTDARIVLDTGLSLTGVVRAHDGSFAVGARVRVEGGEATVRTTTTDANGRFGVRGLAETELGSVAVLAAGNAIAARSPVAIHANASEVVEIRLEPAMPLAGRVVDAHGKPIADALVRIEGDRKIEREDFEPELLEALLDENERTTDRDGRFRFATLYDGTFVLRVSSPSEPDLVATKTSLSGHEDLEIVVDRSQLERVVFRGRVRDALSKDPVTDFALAPMRRTSDTTWSSARTELVHDERGEFRIVGFEPDRYYLRVSAPGHAPWTSEERTLNDGVSDFDVALYPTRSLAIEMRWASKPLAMRSARVRFADASGKEVFYETGHGSYGNGASVHEGVQTISGLPAMPLTVTLAHEQAGELSRDVDLTQPATEPVVFELGVSTKSYDFLLLATRDANLLDAAADVAYAALGDKRVEFVAAPVDLSFVDAGGKELAHARLDSFDGGQHRIVLRTPGTTATSTDPGPPVVTVEVDAKAVAVRVSGEGLVERRVVLVPHDERELVPLVLLRAP